MQPINLLEFAGCLACLRCDTFQFKLHYLNCFFNDLTHFQNLQHTQRRLRQDSRNSGSSGRTISARNLSVGCQKPCRLQMTCPGQASSVRGGSYRFLHPSKWQKCRCPRVPRTVLLRTFLIILMVCNVSRSMSYCIYWIHATSCHWPVAALAGSIGSEVESVDGTYCFDFSRAFAEADESSNSRKKNAGWLSLRH